MCVCVCARESCARDILEPTYVAQNDSLTHGYRVGRMGEGEREREEERETERARDRQTETETGDRDRECLCSQTPGL